VGDGIADGLSRLPRLAPAPAGADGLCSAATPSTCSDLIRTPPRSPNHCYRGRLRWPPATSPPGSRTIDPDLRALPCDALAGAAAETQLGQLLGKTLGKLAGRAAKDLVGGSVAVRVKIEADSRDLPNAKVTRTIGVGCGLKPLKLDIDLSKLPPLPSGLPPFPSGLPPLPSGLPPLPFPFPEDDSKKVRP
jgi:hypothetical protein